MPHKLRNSQLIEYNHAAAGHPGVLASKDGSLFIKPCKHAEIDFYQSVAAHPDFQLHTPTFMGALALQEPAAAAAALAGSSEAQNRLLGPPPLVANEWSPSTGVSIAADSQIVLDNVCHGFRKPNVLDVKLGARLWADDAPQAKRIKLDKASDETTSRLLGFRIAGMKVWAGEGAAPQDQDVDGYRKYDKNYGRSFNAETVSRGFETFFFSEKAGVTKRLGKKVIERCLVDLKDLLEVLEKEESRMYSSSLLFVYEGDGECLSQNVQAQEEIAIAHNTEGNTDSAGPENEDSESSGSGDDSDSEPEIPKVQALKMIDFAHAAWTKGQGPDENVLHGVRNVVGVLEKLLG